MRCAAHTAEAGLTSGGGGDRLSGEIALASLVFVFKRILVLAA